MLATNQLAWEILVSYCAQQLTIFDLPLTDLREYRQNFQSAHTCKIPNSIFLCSNAPWVEYEHFTIHIFGWLVGIENCNFLIVFRSLCEINRAVEYHLDARIRAENSRCVLFSNCAIYLMWFIYHFILAQHGRMENVFIANRRMYRHTFTHYTHIHTPRLVFIWGFSSFNPYSIQWVNRNNTNFHRSVVVGAHVFMAHITRTETIQLKPISGRMAKGKSTAAVIDPSWPELNEDRKKKTEWNQTETFIWMANEKCIYCAYTKSSSVLGTEEKNGRKMECLDYLLVSFILSLYVCFCCLCTVWTETIHDSHFTHSYLGSFVVQNRSKLRINYCHVLCRTLDSR